MGKFKVGDKVRVCTADGWTNGIVLGEYKSCSGLYLTKVPDGHGWSANSADAKYCEEDCGTIVEMGRNCYWNATEFDMKPLKLTEGYAKRPKRRIVIEITDDGANAKYVFGKEVDKTASIKRHPNDKPDDEMAAMFVMQKLFGYDLWNIEKAADEKIRLNEEAIRWICGAKEALDQAEKRIRKLI